MKELNFKRKYRTWQEYNWMGSGPVITERSSLNANFNAGRLSICSSAFTRYFSLPRACLNFTLVFTKTKPDTDEAYQIEGFRSGGIESGSADYATLDNHKPPLCGAEMWKLVTLWNEGYNWVRCEVNDG